MKKLLVIFLTACLCVTLLTASVFAAESDSAAPTLVSTELSDYGQKTHAISYTEMPPIIDGVVEQGEYGEPIHTLIYDPEDPSQYWHGEDFPFLNEILPEKAELYMTFDQDYLYIAAVVTDANHHTPGYHINIWDGDYLEFDYNMLANGSLDDMRNGRHRIAFGVSNDGMDFAYTATVPSYCLYNSGSLYLPDTELRTEYSVRRDEENHLTIYEGALEWMDLTGEWRNIPETAFFMFQFGVANSNYTQYANGTNAYLGTWRYAFLLDASEVGEDAAGLVTHIMTLPVDQLPSDDNDDGGGDAGDGGDTPIDTTDAPITDAPITDAPITDAPTTDAPTTDAPTTDAPTTTGGEEGCASAVGPSTLATLAITAACGVAICRKKKKR